MAEATMMKDVIMVVVSYIAVIFMGFGILAWLQAGFLLPFLKVKTSRGRKILVKIIKSTGSDYVAAHNKEGSLAFKYFKENKVISKFKKGLYRSFNMNCVDVDGETWGIVTTDFESVSTNDPTKTDSLIERALLRPDKKTTREVIILLLLVVIVLAVLFVAYKLIFVQTLIQGMTGVGGRNI